MRHAWWLIPVVLALAGGAWLASFVFVPSQLEEETTVFIPKGSGVRGIQALLHEKGVLENARDPRFLVLAKLSGLSEKLQAGEYRIPPRKTPLQILRLMAEGRVVRHMVTIPEGLNLRQTAELLAGQGWVDPERFLELAGDPDFIKRLGFELESLEGYLFPDTYQLVRGEATEQTIIAMMVKRFREVWNEETEGLTPALLVHQVVTLASIVEKETGDPAERPLIARVFLNRLEKNMRLQSDPTVIYGIKNFSGNLTRKDLAQESPYNTYLVKGLPPGPICSPGRESIAAVLHPADAPYLYFVSRNDGTHYFSTTLQEHNRAVRQFQRNGKRAGSGNE
ncbi:MAG: endolytic transglycosylase MltG [Desulfobulbaceae bacterium]